VKIAADVSPGQTYDFAQIMDQEQPRLHVVGITFPLIVLVIFMAVSEMKQFNNSRMGRYQNWGSGERVRPQARAPSAGRRLGTDGSTSVVLVVALPHGRA
jgi:hypothetical protein